VSFRGRILLACMAAALLPLLLFAIGARREVRLRTAEQFAERGQAAAAGVRQELTARAASIDLRLASLAERLREEPAPRAALLQGGDPATVLDYAPRVMPAAGLDYLLLIDADGTVRSAGHFRADHGRSFPWLSPLREAGDVAVIRARRAEGPMHILARAHEFTIAGRRFALVGGVRIDTAFVRSLARDESGAVAVQLELSDDAGHRAIGPDDLRVQESIAVPYIDDAGGRAPGLTHLLIVQSTAPLRALQRGLDRWLVAAIVAAIALAWMVAVLVARRVNRPLAELARKSRRVDLERLDTSFATRRTDEIGTLSRLLDAMVERLRAGAVQLRTAERRATVGDMARQVNHDIRNGLLPIRNVIRHLDEVAAQSPTELPAVFAERAATLRSGVAYLENLATNYARLTPSANRESCDVNASIRASLGDGVGGGDPRVRLELGGEPLRVHADAVALRRIVENLTVNAIDSLENGSGTVTVRAWRDGKPDGASIVITIADTGRGIAAQELERVFDDFYTTKSHGSGLGLSIVRRLVADLGGRIRVESVPGRGTTFHVELPEAA
jgi:signal transduction histidine kinase